MKYIQKFLILFSFIFFVTTSFANEVTLSQEGQIVLETINKLESSGYITEKNAIEAKNEFVFNGDHYKMNEEIEASKSEAEVDNGINIADYITLIGTFKTLGVLLLLVAFRGVVMKFIHLFTKIPQIVYQVLVLALTLTATFKPEVLWASQAEYIALFGVIANVFVFAWFVAIYEKTLLKLLSYISFNLNPAIVASFYLTLYFGYFAISMDSQTISFFALFSLEAMFGFFIFTYGLTTYIGYEEEDYITISYVVNLVLVGLYSFVSITGFEIPYFNHFEVAIPYVSSIVLAVTLLIKTSFFYSDEKGFGVSIIVFILLTLFSIYAGIAFELEVLPAVMNTAFVIFILGWIGYLTSEISGILTATLIGLGLYGFALLIEKYPSYFITSIF
tara:strand:- start:2473 stop:3639 length:1167 start_codon:yes stop_codon:yes gene_type:complete